MRQLESHLFVADVTQLVLDVSKVRQDLLVWELEGKVKILDDLSYLLDLVIHLQKLYLSTEHFKGDIFRHIRNLIQLSYTHTYAVIFYDLIQDTFDVIQDTSIYILLLLIVFKGD